LNTRLFTKTKFSYLNVQKTGIKSWPVGVSDSLVAASLSSSSWNRHAAAINSFTCFLSHKNTILSLPMEINLVRVCVNWALTSKKIDSGYDKILLVDLKTVHKIRNLEPKFGNYFFINAMLRGARNVSLYSAISKKSKVMMSFPLLKIIGHEIATNNWSQDSKTVFWSAYCVAFFGSFCLDEILPKSTN
jgi:hypothetical protein